MLFCYYGWNEIFEALKLLALGDNFWQFVVKFSESKENWEDSDNGKQGQKALKALLIEITWIINEKESD